MWAKMPLGMAPKRAEDPRRVMLSKFLIPAELPHVPDSWDGYLGGKAAPQMYANNQYGDCTIAGLANHARIQAAVDGRPLPEFTDQEIVEFYFKLSGGKDTGLIETDVLDHVVKHGFPNDGRYKFIGRATIDHTDWDALQMASYLFGGVYLGVGLPERAQSMGEHWSVQGDGKTGPDAPWSWGGHCMVMSGHDLTPSPADKPGQAVGNVSLATWGSVVYATKHWLSVYTDEAYVLLDESHLLMPGIDSAALLAALALLDS